MTGVDAGSQRLSPGGWPVLCGALAAASAAWFAVSLPAPAGPAAVGWLPLPACGLAAGATCRQAAAVPGLAAPARRFWLRIALSVLTLTVAVIGNWYDTFSGRPVPAQRMGPVTAGLYVAGVLIVPWALVRLPGRRDGSRGDRLRFALDAATVMVAGGLLIWHFSYAHRLGWLAPGVPALPTLVVATLALMVAVGCVKTTATGGSPVDRRALHLLTLTALAGAPGAAAAPVLAGRPDLDEAHLVFPVVCFLVACAAARQRLAAAGRDPGRDRDRPASRRRTSLAPYAAVTATDALLLAGVHYRSAEGRLVAAGAVVLTALVVLRQVTVLIDNSGLVARLDRSLTEARRAQEQLAHRATHDELTRLPNRFLFESRTDQALAAAGDRSDRVTVVFLDLDDFKAVNYHLGHAVGDAVLVGVADRLVNHAAGAGVVARLGGDEFGVLVHDNHPRPPAGTGATDRVTAALADPVEVGGYHLLIRASLGLASGEPGMPAGELLRRADVAMSSAKARGKGRVAGYHPDLDARSAEYAQLGAQLRRALDHHEFHLLYQPIVTLPDGRPTGVEALVRWHHPERGLVSPAQFIPVAEQTGLILPLGAWVLDRACRELAGWRREHGAAASATVNVNVSARQLREPGMAADVAAVLAEHRLAPDQLVVEVTETAVFDSETAVKTLDELHGLGVQVALDDFGTGHSSLELLHTCPADIVKIDKSFVDGVTGTTAQAAIVTSMIHIATRLRMRAVAEGVETAAQASRLHQLGYRYAQGYYFARPLPVTEVGTLFSRC